MVQIYDHQETFLNNLEGFVVNGLITGQSVLTFATSGHLQTLERRLKQRGLDIIDLAHRDQYIPMDAQETLSRFMVNGWPNEERFYQLIHRLVTRARKNGRRVRAFGEMVALLWSGGNTAATAQLEQLWNKYCVVERIHLYCAYPKDNFSESVISSVKHLCKTPTMVMEGCKSPADILHRSLS